MIKYFILFTVLIVTVMSAYCAHTEILKLKQQLIDLQGKTNRSREETVAPFSTENISDDMRAYVLELKQSGRIPEAVYAVRKSTSISLADAKKYVDDL